MKKEEVISSGLLELYAMRISSAEEDQVVEQALVQYPELKDELILIEKGLENYAFENAVEPSSRVKEKLFAELFPSENTDAGATAPENVETEKQVTKENVMRISSFYKIAVAALVVLLIGSVVISYNYSQKYRNMKKELAVAQQQIRQQQQSNEALTSDLNVVTDKYAQPVVLKGTPKAPDAVAKIFWLKNSGQVYVDPSNLPAPPAGRQYQLWAIVDGKPVDAGMIETEKGRYSIQRMKSFGKADAFAITLEKTGGSTAPTMDEMVVISQL